MGKKKRASKFLDMTHREVKGQLQSGTFVNEHSGKKTGWGRGRKHDLPLSKFDSPQDAYWTKVANEFMRSKGKKS